MHARDLAKNYGGIKALDGVSFELRPGEVHGLCGENGAGKSTFIKILGGFVVPGKGNVMVNGKLLRPGRRTDPSLISIVHQELSIIPHLSVLDNVMLGASEVGEIYIRRRYALKVRHQLDAVGLSHIDVDRQAHTLSLAERQLVEIARGLARGAKVLMLDEPTATLSDAEIVHVFDVIRRLKAAGTAVLLITHRLGEVFSVADRVTVFRNGRNVMTKDIEDLDTATLVQEMIGRVLAPPLAAGKKPKGTKNIAVRLRDWALAGAFGPIELDIHTGEIVAIVGQLGSGAEILLESLAGLRPTTTGEMFLNGTFLKLLSVRQVLATGIAYVAEDRAGKGVFLDAPVTSNLTCQILPKVVSGGFIRREDERVRARSLARKFSIDPNRLPDRTGNLSGGNQQKVSLAKAAAIDPKLLVLNEPTRGVDVGARAEIYGKLKSMTDEGMAIVMYSTDLEEVLEVADRVVTIFGGTVVRVMSRSEVTEQKILNDILHSKTTAESPAMAGLSVDPDLNASRSKAGV